MGQDVMPSSSVLLNQASRPQSATGRRRFEPLCDYKPCFQELQDICVDYVEVPRKIKLYAGGGTGPLRQRSSSSLAFLVDGGLPESDSANSVTDSCDGSESEVEHGTDDECIFSNSSPSDAQGDPSSNASASSPSPAIRSTLKRYFSARANKNCKWPANSEFFKKDLMWKL